MKLQKFENVDVIASLEAIMKQNTCLLYTSSLPLPGCVYLWRPLHRIPLKRLQQFLNVPDRALPQGAKRYFLTGGKRLTEDTGQP